MSTRLAGPFTDSSIGTTKAAGSWAKLGGMSEPSPIPIAVRAFTTRAKPEEDDDAPRPIPEEALRPTYFVAIDTETTVDAEQRLTFGGWLYCRLDWNEDFPTLVPLGE